jgi:2OG-Fe(II) oxygenase superfamily
MQALKQILTQPPPPKKCYAKRPHAFPLEYLEVLQKGILASSYLAESQLSNEFVQTQGFSIVFKRDGMDQVYRQFPFFQPYIETALKPACNAFYLNPLILSGDSCVKPHVDCSLSSYGKVWTVPCLVSVLYVSVPSDLQGGQLILKDKQTWEIEPEQNLLLHFLGTVIHSVNPVQTVNKRISLVCEQYNLPQERLDQIPSFDIQSALYETQ